MAKPAGHHVFNAFRGALIGTAEAVPGVSGGTVALITGVYEKLIGGAGHLTSALRMGASDLPRAAAGPRVPGRSCGASTGRSWSPCSWAWPWPWCSRRN